MRVRHDGYINATDITKELDVRLDNLHKTKWFIAIAQDLSVRLNQPINAKPVNYDIWDIDVPTEKPLIDSEYGRNGGVYWHPLLAEEVQRAMRYKAIVKPSREEAEVVARYSGRTEVVTPVGRIDILTPTLIIEVKRIKQWKSALGQVLAYHHFYPNHQPHLILFGKVKPLMKRTINAIANDCGVTIEFVGG